MASVTIIKGPDRGKRIELDSPQIVIGRDLKSQIRIRDTEASRKHAEIRVSDNGFILRDLNSSNGTYLNGTPIELAQLSAGDQIRIGQSHMVFHSDSDRKKTPSNLVDLVARVRQDNKDDSSAILMRLKSGKSSHFFTQAQEVESVWLKNALANLAVMYETSYAVSRISDIDQLLDHIMGLVFQSTNADRGCILLNDKSTGKLIPKATRYENDSQSETEFELSSSIVQWVMRNDEGVIVLDAAQDKRFEASASVANLGIREAICVPLKGRHETHGVIYIDFQSLDHSVIETQQPTRISDEHLKLMMAIGHQAALAIEENQFYKSMVQAERLVAIGQTIATISHHIKNILQGLKSGSYLVDTAIEQSDMGLARQGWDTVQKNQAKIYDLVMDMLSYSKERVPTYENVELNKLVHDVYELLEAKAKDSDIDLSVEIQEDLKPIACEYEAIHRALVNIVSNALDAVAERDAEDPNLRKTIVRTRTDQKNRYQYIEVIDTGSGIPNDRIDEIFQIFCSTKGSKGTGIGLAVSKKIALEHGGDIRVQSKVGHGSTFTLELPIRTMEIANQLSELTINPTDPDIHIGNRI